MRRIPVLDLARGFTVFFMPAIHVVMLYSKPDVQVSILGWALRFIAEGTGAQVFMMVMGISFTYSKKNDLHSTFVKALVLFLIGYILNFLKFIVPSLWGGLPKEILRELNLPANRIPISLLLLIDILHFSALALPVIAIVYRVKRYQLVAILLGVVVLIMGPYLWDIKTHSSLADYFLQAIGGHPPQAYFPFFPWIIYPLAGLSVGYYLHRSSHNYVFKWMGIIGMLVIIVSLLFKTENYQEPWPAFYRTGFGDSLFHLGIVFCWLCFLFHCMPYLTNTVTLRFFSFLSKNITIIYVIQWIVICWCLGIAGYAKNNFVQSVFWMIGITVSTFYLSLIISKKMKNGEEKNL